MLNFIAPWSDQENRKKFFENYARSCGFDPHVPENWYSVQKQALLSVKVKFLTFFFIRWQYAQPTRSDKNQ
jgi:hypothetical protein